MNHVTSAKELFESGFNCAQAVFVPYAEEFGLNKEPALKLSCGFGGGMAHQQKTCGAVTGAYMVIGLKNGKYLKEDDPAREKTYVLVNEFTQRFMQHHGTTECRDLLQCDLNTEEGRRYHKEHQLRTTVCTKCVEEAIVLLDELLMK